MPTATALPHRRIQRLMATVAVTASLALGVGVAHPDLAHAAKPAKVSTTIKLTPNKKFLTGKIASPKAACKRNRPVALFYKQTQSQSFGKIRTPKSNARGVWSQKAPGKGAIPSGFYYAKIAAKAGCKPVRSATFRVR